jgi:hypothetical protein
LQFVGRSFVTDDSYSFCVAANGWIHDEVSVLDMSEELYDKVMGINASGSKASAVFFKASTEEL